MQIITSAWTQLAQHAFSKRVENIESLERERHIQDVLVRLFVSKCGVRENPTLGKLYEELASLGLNVYLVQEDTPGDGTKGAAKLRADVSVYVEDTPHGKEPVLRQLVDVGPPKNRDLPSPDHRKLQRLRNNADSRRKAATAWLATIIELKIKQTTAKKLKKQVIRYASQYRLLLGIESMCALGVVIEPDAREAVSATFWWFA